MFNKTILIKPVLLAIILAISVSQLYAGRYDPPELLVKISIDGRDDLNAMASLGVDADDANNPFNWQWVAGSGADAAPYFRIFNPELQAKKFDPRGLYISQWASDAPDEPIVDLAETRNAALAAYDVVKRAPRD